MRNLDNSEKWAKTQLGKFNPINFVDVVKTEYSHVVKIECEKHVFYLKKNDLNFNSEANIIELLNKSGNNSLELISQNKELNCIITNECGINLSKVNLDDFNLYENISKHLIKIQIETSVDDLKKAGAREFSESQMLYLCDKYQIKNNDIFKDLIEIEKILPNSFEHGDLHFDNILINKNKVLCLIDLTDVTITNPLYSLISLENELSSKMPERQDIVDDFNWFWLSEYSKKSNIKMDLIEKAYVKSKNIYPLYCIFCLDCLLKTAKTEEFKNKINKKISKFKKELDYKDNDFNFSRGLNGILAR